jgi:[ribosomal protein S5]-alanine N-acetyltransferase
MDDLPLAATLWGDPEVTQFIGGPFSAAAVEQRLRSQIDMMTAHRLQYWPVFLLAGGALAGCAGLRPYRLEDRIYELGFHLRPPYWGRGLATEAGGAVVTFGFESLGAEALFAGHHPANATSRRVLEKLGFRFTHEEVYPPTGLKHPSYLLTRSEYAARSKTRAAVKNKP